MSLAKQCKKCLDFKEYVDFSKDNSKVDKFCIYCKICNKKIDKEYYNKNKEKKKEYQRTNKENIRKRKRKYYLKNSEYFINCAKDYAKNNKEKVLLYYKNYKKVNRSHYNALDAKRRATKLMATPKWLTKKQLKEIEDIYELCREMSKGAIKYEVDHIIPLKGKEVTGLHVPWNLQILTKEQNHKKINKINII